MSNLERLVKGDVGKDGGSCDGNGGGGHVGIVRWSKLKRAKKDKAGGRAQRVFDHLT